MKFVFKIIIVVAILVLIGGFAVYHRLTVDESAPYLKSMVATYTCSIIGANIDSFVMLEDGEVVSHNGCFRKESKAKDFDTVCVTNADCSGFCMPANEVDGELTDFRCSNVKKPVFYEGSTDLITKLP